MLARPNPVVQRLLADLEFIVDDAHRHDLQAELRSRLRVRIAALLQQIQDTPPPDELERALTESYNGALYALLQTHYTSEPEEVEALFSAGDAAELQLQLGIEEFSDFAEMFNISLWRELHEFYTLTENEDHSETLQQILSIQLRQIRARQRKAARGKR